MVSDLPRGFAVTAWPGQHAYTPADQRVVQAAEGREPRLGNHWHRPDSNPWGLLFGFQIRDLQKSGDPGHHGLKAQEVTQDKSVRNTRQQHLEKQLRTKTGKHAEL